MFFSSNTSVQVTVPPPTPPTTPSGFKIFFSILSLFRFFISPAFWSKFGFFVSYVLTFLLVLEVVRLASTDANRKEVERMLDAWSAGRSEGPVRRRSSPAGMKGGRKVSPVKEERRSVNIEELEDIAKEEKAETMSISIDQLEAQMAKQQRTLEKHQRTRTPSPAVTRTPEYERTADKEERRRRRAASTSISPSTKIAAQPLPSSHTQHQTSTSTSPARRLRKRSDTLTSSGSAESKGAVRRRREVREASPASSSSSSRHASPTPRSRSKETRVLGTSLGKMLRSRA